MGRLFNAIIDVDYWYHAFTYVPNHTSTYPYTVLANKKTNERYAHTIIPFLPNKGTKVTLKFHIHDQFLPSDAY